MTTLRKLDFFRLLLGATILASLAFGYYANPSIFLAELLLITTAIFSTYLLSDILKAWLLLLSGSIGLVFLIAGVVLLTPLQQLVLFLTFPLVLALTSQVQATKGEILSLVKDEQKSLVNHYQQLLATARETPFWTIEAIMVNWAHSSHFYHVNPSAYRDMLRRIHQILLGSLTEGMTVYYVSGGSFLILLAGQQPKHRHYFTRVIKPKLTKLRFQNFKFSQETQYRQGYLVLDSSNLGKFKTSGELLKYLNRQLETDIIVEY